MGSDRDPTRGIAHHDHVLIVVKGGACRCEDVYTYAFGECNGGCCGT